MAPLGIKPRTSGFSHQCSSHCKTHIILQCSNNHLKHGLYGLGSKWLPMGHHSSVTRALAAKAKCAGFNSQRCTCYTLCLEFIPSWSILHSNHRVVKYIVVKCLSLTMLPVAVCIPVRNRSSPKERAMHRLRWTKLWSFSINSFLQQ